MSAKIEKEKLKFIESRLDKLKSNVISLESKLFRMVITNFLINLETKNGQIANTPGNINLISTLDKIYNRFNDKNQNQLALNYANDLITIGSLNQKYFDTIVEKSDKEINERLNKRALKILGVEKKGKKTILKKDGYLQLFLNDTSVKTQLKRRAVLAIQSGMTIQQLRETISTDLISSKKKEGLLKRYWRTNAFDTYTAFDRSSAKALADEYKMQAAMWSAGEEKDSRHICDKQNGKVYLREEIEELKKFANKKRGKTYIGPIVENPSTYNPFIQQGGINCKHSWRWVSNRFALRRDKTLSEENGVLIRKSGKNPNNSI